MRGKSQSSRKVAPHREGCRTSAIVSIRSALHCKAPSSSVVSLKREAHRMRRRAFLLRMRQSFSTRFHRHQNGQSCHTPVPRNQMILATAHIQARIDTHTTVLCFQMRSRNERIVEAEDTAKYSAAARQRHGSLLMPMRFGARPSKTASGVNNIVVAIGPRGHLGLFMKNPFCLGGFHHQLSVLGLSTAQYFTT